MGKCYNSTVVDAPMDKVWSVLRNFHDMSWATGSIETCEPVGAISGSQVGAKRVLNGVFQETLVGIDDHARSITYQITNGPPPLTREEVSEYFGVVRLHPVTVGEGTFVEWSSTWIGNESAVGGFCDPIYRALLTALKQSM